jgi:alpha-L-arabinofuranosidase
MYNVHQDALMIPLSVTSNDYSFEGKNLKAVSASASKDKSGVVHISLVNIDAHNSQDVTIALDNFQAKAVTGRILRSEKIQDHNTYDNPTKVKPQPFTGATLNGKILSLKIPAFSVVVLELK